MHVSLDGFVAGPNGEMNWIKVNDQMFEFAGDRINFNLILRYMAALHLI